MLVVWRSLSASHSALTNNSLPPAPSNRPAQVIRLASAIQVAFSLSSPLNRLHELSTIQQMAAYVAEVAAEDAGTVALAPRQWPDAQLRPASLGQEQVRYYVSLELAYPTGRLICVGGRSGSHCAICMSCSSQASYAGTLWVSASFAACYAATQLD
jgi:hypothetical protein